MQAEKQLLLDEIKELIDRHDSFVIFQYSGVMANSMGDFRNSMAKVGGDVQMMRKRILLKAAEQMDVELDEEALDGHVGLAFTGEDTIETEKVVYDFSKETGEQLSVIGGRIDGELYNAEQVKTLSQLPGKDEMRAQLLATFEAPMSQTVGTMDSLLTSLLHCLQNKVDKEGSA